MNRDFDIGPSTATDTSFQGVRLSLMVDRPDLDPNPVLHELRAFAEWRRKDRPLSVPPSRHEVEHYLAECIAQLGEHYGAARLHRVQVAAPSLWGMSYASMITVILRYRERPVMKRGATKADSARTPISRLPDEWQPGLVARMSSEPGPRKLKWSIDHLGKCHACPAALAGMVRKQGAPT